MQFTTLSILAILAFSSVDAHSDRQKAIQHARRNSHRNHAASASKKNFSPSSQFTVKKRSDGTLCKVRGTNTTSTLLSSVPATSSSAPASSSSSSVWVAPTTSSTSIWVAPTTSTSQWVAPTTTTSQWVAPTTTTTWAAATTSVSSSSSSSSSSSTRKFGLGWANGDTQDPSGWASWVGNSWYYTWSAYPVSEMSSLEFVPMLWGTDYTHTSEFSSQISSWPSSTNKALFLNEPNNSGQSNVDASTACGVWQSTFETLRSDKGYTLGSAAPDNSASGLQWLKDFNTACPNNQPDFYVIHWYGTAGSDLQSYIESFETAFPGKDLWVTEYADENFSGGAQASYDDVVGSFFSDTTSWMCGRSSVARFAPFGAMSNMQGVSTFNQLLTDGGSPTALGSMFINNSC